MVGLILKTENNMNLNNFTIKGQEAIQFAFQIAQGNKQQAVETGHLFKGLFHSAENVVEFLLKKLDVNVAVFQQAIDKTVPRPKIILVDWKGCGQHKEHVVKLLENMNLEYEKIK